MILVGTVCKRHQLSSNNLVANIDVINVRSSDFEKRNKRLSAGIVVTTLDKRIGSRHHLSFDIDDAIKLRSLWEINSNPF